jgi:histidinol-phosphate aminotransferase
MKRKGTSLTDIIKLASNENPLGPSPMAMQAMAENIPEMHLYRMPIPFT